MDFKTALMASFSKPTNLICCDDVEAWVEEIDFEAVEAEMQRIAKLPKDERGADIIGQGFEIKGNTAFVKVTGLLVPNLGMDLAHWGITGYDIIGDYIEHANEIAADYNIEKITYEVNSGGGLVNGIAGLVDVMEASELPITVLVTGHMASAAYWIGCTGESIDAVKDAGSIGSIGVRATHIDVSERLKMMGVKKSSFTSGFWKDAFADHKPLSKRAIKQIQAEVDADALDFFEHVSKNRTGLSVADVKGFEAGLFNVKKALQLGLIDTIGEDKSQHDDPKKGSNAMADDTKDAKTATLTQAEADALAKTAVDKALKDAKAKTDADAARRDLITAHTSKADGIKTILQGSGFASVPDADITALLDAIPKGFTAAMDDDKGAGVGGDNQEITDEDKAKAAKAETVKATNAKVKDMKFSI